MATFQGDSSRPATVSNKIAVAAIDFGTTCTGYAYYLQKDTKQNLITSINIEQSWEGGAEIGLQAPTTVLMDPNQTFHSFGFEAETKYKSLTLTNEHKEWYYFRYFKMSLHHEKELSRDMMLKDSDGKSMRAIIVFTEAIKYVHNHLLKKLRSAVVDEIRPDQVSWVLTVPAIWRDSAKQFMREASVQAGIPSDDLILALEPESAAIFCKDLALKQKGGVDGVFLSAFNPNEKYLICDLGGGTVDTTVHKVKSDGLLEELYAATGGDWGGQQVNTAFEQLLIEITGEDAFKSFRTEHAHAWIKLQKSFEVCKRQFSSSTEECDIDLPNDFEVICKQSHILKSLPQGINIINDTLGLNKAEMSKLFKFATSKTVEHIEGLLKQPKLRDVSSILLVGGFSESPVVKKTIKDHFRNSRVIAPESAGSAIIKGAVMFGLDQRIIAARLSPYTYGIHTRRLFNKKVHPKNRKKSYKGKEVVENAFSRQITKGSLVYVGSEPTGSTFTVVSNKNRDVFWNVYQSTKETPEFCDEEGCSKIGQLKVTIPDSVKDQKLSLRVTMTCRGTELEAKAFLVDYPQVETVANLEFLDHEYAFGGDFIED